MKSHAKWVSLLLVAGLGLAYSAGSFAAVTAEHRKQIDEVKKELGKVKSMIAKKDFDDAVKLLEEAEQKLRQVAKDAGIEETSKPIGSVLKQVEKDREAIAKKRGAGGAAAGGGGPGVATVAFERDVAPILAARCLGCHGTDNPRGGLQIDTFNGIVQGGANGALVVPGKPGESLLVQRISATGTGRMPKGANPLSPDEIKKIGDWIKSGARFTGNNSTPIASLKASEQGGKADTVSVQINKPTGGETVSFVRDIAPWMSNLCVNCHSGADPRSGFSLETFEKLMKGGSSGRVVLAGNTKDSRLWHLVGEQETPDGKPLKMPPGQALITRTNHSNLKTWIEEGAKFDGNDPKASLRSLVPTETEKRAKELAALSPEEFAKRRHDRASELWKTAFPNETPAQFESEAFLVIGNAAEPRLKQIADWAQADAAVLHKVFKIKEPLIWRGKLIVFVFKDHFSYAEFTQTNERFEVPADTKGHARVTASETEAYVCLQDIGDSPADDSPGVKSQLMALLAEGLLLRSANKVPDWAARGIGLVLAARSEPKNPYFRSLMSAAHEAMRPIDKPQELFANGTFSPSDLAPVGFTLVSHMLKVGDEPHFVQFLGLLSGGKSVDDALKAVYYADTETLARSYRGYVDNLPGAKGTAKKPKK